ncbi:hypothetical protein [Rhodohalobacter mucosus]|uniref:hypothetical protein n=1 Tax=Rhodohalobacter mucosus TaxID=2079485 RepID=UPI0011B27CD9|nr:hypothetical protein [Rhodohalobacter mucosus]
MAKKIIIPIILWISISLSVTTGDLHANQCDYECVIICNDIGISCLNSNPNDQFEDPWGYAEHNQMCKNLRDLCMQQAFPEKA